MYIYLITNLINTKKYIGQTIRDQDVRWNSHKSDSKNPKMVISYAIDKYGIDNFHFEVIDESANNIDELNDLEEFYISFYDTFKSHGYNMTSGGEGYLMSEKTKKRISESNKGKLVTKETRNKLSKTQQGDNNSFYGKVHTNDFVQKLITLNKNRTGLQHTKSKKVIQLDKVTGEEIACWFSMRLVEKELGIQHANISKVCKNKGKTAGGYIWKYL